MKKILTLIFVFYFTICFSQKDYMLQVNDTIVEVNLDEDFSLEIEGKELHFKLSTKDTLTYESDLFSFKYSSDYKISKLEIEEGLTQIMIMTAEGSGVMIQEYTTFSPTMLNEMMISEMTKESLNYGYKMQREKVSKELISGQTIKVDRAILTYKDEKSIYEVATYGGVDEGILVVTMISLDMIKSQGAEIIDTMWNTLSYK